MTTTRAHAPDEEEEENDIPFIIISDLFFVECREVYAWSIGRRISLVGNGAAGGIRNNKKKQDSLFLPSSTRRLCLSSYDVVMVKIRYDCLLTLGSFQPSFNVMIVSLRFFH